MSAGAFVLDSENGAKFHAVFVGRSDLDLNSQLHLYVGVYKRFKYVYCSSAKAAFERECGLFHDFDPYDNAIHPLRQAGSAGLVPAANYSVERRSIIDTTSRSAQRYP